MWGSFVTWPIIPDILFLLILNCYTKPVTIIWSQPSRSHLPKRRGFRNRQRGRQKLTQRGELRRPCARFSPNYKVHYSPNRIRSFPIRTWAMHEISPLRDADIEGQHQHINFPGSLDVMGKQESNPGHDSPRALSILTHLPKSWMGGRDPRWALGTTLLPLPFSGHCRKRTSLFGIKKNRAVWRGQGKPPWQWCRTSQESFVLFFSMWLLEVILVFISPNFPFAKDNSLKSSGKLT